MALNEQQRRELADQGFPSELIDPFLRLMKRREKFVFRMLPKDAYMMAAILQFADRNPGLKDEHHAMIRDFANQLIGAIALVEPIMEPYLLMGWNPEHDQPARDREA